jgi:hypothetical protein
LGNITEYRSPSEIITELIHIQSLIDENKEFIKKYPKDYGLKINLYSFERRENKLLSELRESLIYDLSLRGSNNEKFLKQTRSLVTELDCMIGLLILQNFKENLKENPGRLSIFRDSFSLMTVFTYMIERLSMKSYVENSGDLSDFHKGFSSISDELSG